MLGIWLGLMMMEFSGKMEEVVFKANVSVEALARSFPYSGLNGEQL